MIIKTIGWLTVAYVGYKVVQMGHTIYVIKTEMSRMDEMDPELLTEEQREALDDVRLSLSKMKLEWDRFLAGVKGKP